MATPPHSVLLMPEDVQDQAGVSVPTYGTFEVIVGGYATVRLSTPPHSASIARRRQVGHNEYDTGAPGCELQQKLCHHPDLLGEFNPRPVDLEKVAPVLRFLTSKSRPKAEDVTAEELAERNAEILDRILGTNQRGTRSISHLLAGFQTVHEPPQVMDTLRWTSNLTGVESTVSVRHAVDYAFFVDGNRRIPASARANIGDVFDADPRHANEMMELPSDEETERDDLETLLQSIEGATEAPETTPTPNATYPAAPVLTTTETRVPQDCHTKILSAIADDPNLLRFCLGLSQQENKNDLHRHQIIGNLDDNEFYPLLPCSMSQNPANDDKIRFQSDPDTAIDKRYHHGTGLRR
ncbi:hypothetical protein GN244_ATG11986 [Phytophthora infestans]|uniref:Uncharacterized protein n=1 Tax=Phytophthora infestans TaxID=4787 RepID=A0A833VZX2_PHYIN|nr:hypothetical protein GN244_ATG11986 [Phytophthora infestans]KAF4144623.1 hypothetical protein GN958_ATG06153 [Phytophthora infestans]